MKTIMVYYSRKGSNKFLAKKIAEKLNCEITEIKPKLNSHLLMLMGFNFGNKQLKINKVSIIELFYAAPFGWVN